jgi:ribosomal-protein-serine acetyltransferase
LTGARKLNRVEIRLDVENERNRRVVERLGFRREGVLREAMRIAGAYHDDALYAMLACEWPAAAATGAPAASQRASARGAASSAR